MPNRQPLRRVVAALVVPFLLVVGTGFAHAMYRCQFDKRVRKECCCPKKAKPLPEETQLRATCCEQETTRPVAAAARLQADRFDPDKVRQDLVAAVSQLAHVTVTSSARGIAPLDVHPPPDRPPILLLKNSFLI